MTELLEQAFKKAQKLSNHLQDELAQQLLEDIENELKWQESLSDSDVDLDAIEEMAQRALIEDREDKNDIFSNSDQPKPLPRLDSDQIINSPSCPPAANCLPS